MKIRSLTLIPHPTVIFVLPLGPRWKISNYGLNDTVLEKMMNTPVNKDYENRVTERAKPILKMLLGTIKKEVSFKRILDLSKDVLQVSVSERAVKLRSIKLWGWSHHLGMDPGLSMRSALWTEWQNFFRSSTLIAYNFAAHQAAEI